ncbi:MAG: hypothetical protein ACO1OB_25145 [Archangium sp.]
MRRLLWTAVLVLSACEVPMRDYSHRYAVQRCEREVACEFRPSSTDCNGEQTRSEIERRLLQVQLGMATYSATNAARCLATLSAAPCDSMAELTTECLEVFEGTRQLGEGCMPYEGTWAGGCATGLSCNGSNANQWCGRCTEAKWECEASGGWVNYSKGCDELPRLDEPCFVEPNPGRQPVNFTQHICAPGFICDRTCVWRRYATYPGCPLGSASTGIPASDGSLQCWSWLAPLGLRPEGSACEADGECALFSCTDGVCNAAHMHCE